MLKMLNQLFYSFLTDAQKAKALFVLDHGEQCEYVSMTTGPSGLVEILTIDTAEFGYNWQTQYVSLETARLK
jgi:hypothetical protein